MKIMIDRIDMNGYWGREHHPEPSDEGKVGTVIGWECIDDEDVFTVAVDGEGAHSAPRILEIMGHEVKAIETTGQWFRAS